MKFSALGVGRGVGGWEGWGLSPACALSNSGIPGSLPDLRLPWPSLGHSQAVSQASG